jgi:hypothetical protein
MIDGRTVMEIAGEPRAVDEIAQLWGYLQSRLDGRRNTLLSVVAPAPQQRLFGTARVGVQENA